MPFLSLQICAKNVHFAQWKALRKKIVTKTIFLPMSKAIVQRCWYSNCHNAWPYQKCHIWVKNVPGQKYSRELLFDSCQLESHCQPRDMNQMHLLNKNKKVLQSFQKVPTKLRDEAKVKWYPWRGWGEPFQTHYMSIKHHLRGWQPWGEFCFDTVVSLRECEKKGEWVARGAKWVDQCLMPAKNHSQTNVGWEVQW